jgi:hypothetical protein
MSMNIFVLSLDPKEAAQYHCDKHVVKMILETAQLLCTTHRVVDGDARSDELGFYRPTHKNHPCSVWLRQSSANYAWALSLLQNLLTEYTNRYSKIHKVERSGLFKSLCVQPFNIATGELSAFPQAMPDQYRCIDPVVAYREYYKGEKVRFAKWKLGDIPAWFKIAIQ